MAPYSSSSLVQVSVSSEIPNRFEKTIFRHFFKGELFTVAAHGGGVNNVFSYQSGVSAHQDF